MQILSGTEVSRAMRRAEIGAELDAAAGAIGGLGLVIGILAIWPACYDCFWPAYVAGFLMTTGFGAWLAACCIDP